VSKKQKYFVRCHHSSSRDPTGIVKSLLSVKPFGTQPLIHPLLGHISYNKFSSRILNAVTVNGTSEIISGAHEKHVVSWLYKR
jgi:hypothetical protein